MCMLTFDYPQTYAVSGSTEEQLAQLRSYIWQLVDVLNQMGGGEVEANSGRGNGTVTSVNRVPPDTAGNVQLTPKNVGAVDEDEELTILEIVDMWNNA